jgi:hypothetical protein
MPKLRNTLTFDTTPDAVWAVVGALDAVTQWIPGVTSCTVAGNRRVCNGGEIEEEISD